jgi:hypothetical protein
MKKPVFKIALFAVSFCAGLLLMLLIASNRSSGSTPRASADKALAPASPTGADIGNQPVLAAKKRETRKGVRPTIETEEGIVYQDFQMHPFPVTRTSEHHRWTGITGRTSKEIDLLAHNDLEKERHEEDNLFVRKRELVYREQSLSDLSRRSKETGQPVREIVLPGFEGKEYKVAVTSFESQVDDKGVEEGWLKGHLVSDPEAEVLLGYYGHRESGGFSSKKLGVSIEFDPREDHQVMVKDIDLEALSYLEKETTCNVKYDSHTVGDPDAEL